MNGPGSAGGHPGRRRRPGDPVRRARPGRGDGHGRAGSSAHDNPPPPRSDDAPAAAGEDGLAGDPEDGLAGNPEDGAPALRQDGAPAELTGGGGDAPANARTAERPRTLGRRAVAYFRANPQVFVLLVICLVLGLGTFVAVLISLLTAGSVQTTGEPSGLIIAHALMLG